MIRNNLTKEQNEILLELAGNLMFNQDFKTNRDLEFLSELISPKLSDDAKMVAMWLLNSSTEVNEYYKQLGYDLMDAALDKHIENLMNGT